MLCFFIIDCQRCTRPIFTNRVYRSGPAWDNALDIVASRLELALVAVLITVCWGQLRVLGAAGFEWMFFERIHI